MDASPTSLDGCPLPQSEDLRVWGGGNSSSIHLTLLDSYEVASAVTGAGDNMGKKHIQSLPSLNPQPEIGSC